MYLSGLDREVFAKPFFYENTKTTSFYLAFSIKVGSKRMGMGESWLER